MYASGPFSRVLFVLTKRDGLQTYTYRRNRTDGAGVLVKTCVTVDDDRDFNQRFTNTDLIRI